MTEKAQHNQTQNRDGKKTGRPRDCVVHARGKANAVRPHRIHHRRSEGSDTDSHAEAKYNHGREEMGPVTAANSWQNKESKAKRRDERTKDERHPWAISGDEPARP